MIAIRKASIYTHDGERALQSGVTLCEEAGVFVCRVEAEADCPLDADCAVRLWLGLPEPAEGYVADYLYSPYWCRPFFGQDPGLIPAKTQALLWRGCDGMYTVVLPIGTDGYAARMEGVAGDATLYLFSNTDCLTRCTSAAFAAACGRDPYALLARCAKTAARLSGCLLRHERRYPDVLEYLGWCSWDAMEIWVNEDETLQKCDEFAEKRIPVRWAILDDMWADVAWTEDLPRFTDHSVSFGVMHASRLRDIEADPVRFPHGLSHCVEQMKSRGLQVGIWHPTTGYWRGLAPDSPAAAKMEGCTVTLDGQILPDLSSSAQAADFFMRFHAFLADCGVDFLKVDNQSCLRKKYRNFLPIGKAARHLHDGIEQSAAAYFGGALINCMGMAGENMFGRRESAVSRCSDDFQPENAAWFARHLMQCAWNGLIQGQFCVCDWDMWWSDDAQAGKNALLRAISGGPIYVSDRLFRSRAEVFLPLCFSDGRILRPDDVAVPTEDWLVRDPTATPEAFTVFNRADETVYIAAFHLYAGEGCVNGRLCPAQLCGGTGQYLLFEHFSREVRLLDAEEEYRFELADSGAYRLFSLTPVRDGFAMLGDVNKYIARRAVCDVHPGGFRTVEGGQICFMSAKTLASAQGAGGRALPLTRHGLLWTVTAGPEDVEILLT